MNKCLDSVTVSAVIQLFSVVFVCRVEMKYDPNGRPYYVDHSTRTTSWVRPTPLPPGFESLYICVYQVFHVAGPVRLQ